MSVSKPFFETKSLAEMNTAEWESLCDGCGKCCVILLQEEDSERVYRTNLACKLLDLETVRCSDYANRHQRVPGCVRLTPDNIADLAWMPDTCAYRLLAEGKPLPDWHPLKSGDPRSPERAGISVKGQLVPEGQVPEDDWEDHIVE